MLESYPCHFHFEEELLLIKEVLVITITSHFGKTLYHVLMEHLSRLPSQCRLLGNYDLTMPIVRGLYFPIFFFKQFIGTMSSDEVQRFVSGSSVCPSQGIKVTFNNLSGFARIPISHTCDCCLELPIDYQSSIEFLNEFQSVLSSSEFLWHMDRI